MWSQTNCSVAEAPQLIFSPSSPTASLFTQRALSQERMGELGCYSTIAQPPAAPSLLCQGWGGCSSIVPCIGAEPCMASLLPLGAPDVQPTLTHHIPVESRSTWSCCLFRGATLPMEECLGFATCRDSCLGFILGSFIVWSLQGLQGWMDLRKMVVSLHGAMLGSCRDPYSKRGVE